MTEIEFSNNYSDSSVSHGVDAGFQFEFYCERCSDTWRPAFVPYRDGKPSGWLGKAAGLLGDIAGSLGSAVNGLAQANFGRARDEAFAKAIDQARHHFHRCTKCHSYVCDRCWNTAKGLCLDCRPDVEVEIEAARSQGEVAGAIELASDEGMQRGRNMNLKLERQLVCPRCKAETHGARFCPECGYKLADPATCAACQAGLPPGSRFCTQCGAKAQ